ncbi:hypothetical protein FQA39_LY02797 [Lamprigera yunnana]|nr:hypothetical protein FQA39_LY02797 [Lamprigera yunnana]
MDEQYLHYLYDDSSDSDDKLDHVGNPRRRNEDYLEETVVHYSEEEFYNHFQISRNVASQITEKFESSRYYDHKSGQFGKISALNQVKVILLYC